MLTRSERIHRGFHRVGAVLAALVAIPMIITYRQTPHPAVIYIPISLLTGALVYGVSRALGWIVEGFFGDEK